MSANLCAHCGVIIEDGKRRQRTVARAMSAPIRARGLFEPPGRRVIQRTYYVDAVEVLCADCHEHVQAEAAALEHFHKVFISIIGVLCLLFTLCMIVPVLRAHILAFVHPLE